MAHAIVCLHLLEKYGTFVNFRPIPQNGEGSVQCPNFCASNPGTVANFLGSQSLLPHKGCGDWFSRGSESPPWGVSKHMDGPTDCRPELCRVPNPRGG